MTTLALFIVNDLREFGQERDTTSRLAEASLENGQRCFGAARSDISWHCGILTIDCIELGRGPAQRQRDSRPPFQDWNLIHIRTDPPVDLAFIETLRLLAAATTRAEFVNPPSELMMLSEKLTPFANLMPRSLVTASPSAARRFGGEIGRTVVKPLNDACGRGVHLLDWSPGEADSSERRFAASVAATGSRLLLQEFLPEVFDGETRCWLLDGHPLGWLRKKVHGRDFRFSLERGDTLHPWTPQPAELHAVQIAGGWLRKRGVRIAAVDLINGKIVDVNITSPGLLVELERVTGTPLAPTIASALTASHEIP